MIKNQAIYDHGVRFGHPELHGEIRTYEDFYDSGLPPQFCKRQLVARVKTFAKSKLLKVSRMFLTVVDNVVYCEAFYLSPYSVPTQKEARNGK